MILNNKIEYISPSVDTLNQGRKCVFSTSEKTNIKGTFIAYVNYISCVIEGDDKHHYFPETKAVKFTE